MRDQAASLAQEITGLPFDRDSMAQLAHRGQGPDYEIVGRCARYDPKVVRAWAQALIKPPRAKGMRARANAA
jgi:hypothetical protein